MTDTTTAKNISKPDLTAAAEAVEDFKHLMRDTDAAYRAVGVTLSNATENINAATQAWCDVQSSPTSSPLTTDEGNMRNSLQVKPVFKNPSYSSTADFRYKTSASAKKRKKTFFSRTLKTLSLSTSSLPLRRKLQIGTDINHKQIIYSNVNDLISQRSLKRIRNDMSSKLQISIGRGIGSEAQWKTPSDLSHLESTSLPTTQSLRQTSQDPGYPPSSATSLHRSPQQCGPRKSKFADELSVVGSIDDTTLEFKEFDTSSPSRTSNRGSTYKGLSFLPTILEVLPLNLTWKHNAVKNPIDQISQTRTKDVFGSINYYTLPSTAFSLTAPQYKHGPIRIEKRERRGHGFYDAIVTSPQDESLDWTAFQMAISGTMEEDGGSRRDFWEWEMQEREIDDIIGWWKEFGFDGYGIMEGAPRETLVDHKPAVRITNAASGWNSNDMKLEKDVDENQTSLNSSMSRTWSWASGASETFGAVMNNREEIVISSTYLQEAGGIHPDSAESKLLLADSLPPIPLPDALPNPHEEVDPMGFNLGHDLEDFLEWEAKNVCKLFGTK